MPAVATKVDKVASSDMNNNSTAKISDKKMNLEQTNGQQQTDPVKIANQIIEKKIRNLEKRKARLLELKGDEDKGKHLELEQKEAVKKLDNVIELIDTCKEIKKNVNDALIDCQKQLKKQAKKDQNERTTERNKEEHERLKLWVQGQYVLGRFPYCKDDLLVADGEVKVSEKEVQALEQLVEFTSNATSTLPGESFDKLVLFFEGSKKEFVAGLSYLEVKTVLQRLVRSKYFDSVPLVPKVEEKPEAAEPVKLTEDVRPLSQPGPISFLNRLDTDLHKDPAVVAVAASTAGSFIAPAGSQVFTSPHFYLNPTVSMGSIPSQTFTNQAMMEHVNNEIAQAHVNQQLAGLNIGSNIENDDSQPKIDGNSSLDENCGNETSQQISETTADGKVGGPRSDAHGVGYHKRTGPGARGPRPQNGRGGYNPRGGNRFGGRPNGHFGGQRPQNDGEAPNPSGERAPRGEPGARGGKFRSYNGGPRVPRTTGGPNKLAQPKPQPQPAPAQ